MHVLVLKHGGSEALGTLEAFLESHGVDVVGLDVGSSTQVPNNPQKAAAIVITDGPADGSLGDERSCLREAVRMGVPVLGIGLGAELLAEACGGRALGAGWRETGFSRVRLTPEGQKEPLLNGFEDEFEVFARRGDNLELPDGAVLLAEADGCRNQAFRYGSNAYGLQFHVEVTPNMVSRWFEGRPERTEALRAFHRLSTRLNRMTHLLCLNFLSKIIRSSTRGREVRAAEGTRP